ncbi:discoidin domain-containing protein [Kribbella aluminosa]|uniref:discoidin domain-containing protein n=1 Tax=Kribbella aluminosa TaxID=416017 RepID=UPI003CD08C20
MNSEETAVENAPTTNVLDGGPETWHTKQSGSAAPMPHEIQLNLGRDRTASCLFYLPRQSASNGRVATYEAYTGRDGSTCGGPGRVRNLDQHLRRAGSALQTCLRALHPAARAQRSQQQPVDLDARPDQA